MLVYLLQGLTLGLSATATPGPFQAFLIAQTVKNGYKRTLPAALAPLVSDGPIILLVLLVLTQTPAWFLTGLQIAGGVFILYLSRGILMTLKVGMGSPATAPPTARQDFLKAALMNTLSPGPYIFWSLIAGPIVLAGWRESVGLAGVFMLGFYAALIGGNALFVLLFASANQLGPKVSFGLRLVSALTLLAFGLYQIGAGIVALRG